MICVLAMHLTVTVAAQICQKDGFQLPLPLQLVLASMITAKELPVFSE